MKLGTPRIEGRVAQGSRMEFFVSSVGKLPFRLAHRCLSTTVVPLVIVEMIDNIRRAQLRRQSISTYLTSMPSP